MGGTDEGQAAQATDGFVFQRNILGEQWINTTPNLKFRR
jgi:hypothetical protein